MNYTKSEAKAYCREHMTGVWAALTTPFTPEGELDEEGLRKIVRTCIDDLKIDGFFCNGLMGEYWSLSPEERKRVQHIVCEESRGGAQTIPPHPAHQHQGSRRTHQTRRGSRGGLRHHDQPGLRRAR